MSDSPVPDWSVTTFDGNRMRQHREFQALPFREKVRRLEEMAETAARVRAAALRAPAEQATPDANGAG
jgi:hypothetical protein